MPFLRFLACGLLLAASTLPAHAAASPFSDLTVLGDSLSDEGNLLAATSALGPSLGQPAQPDLSHYDQGRFSNGPVYPEVLASDLGVTITPSLLGGTNFAFGGARTNYNTVEVPPYGTQVYPRAAYPWSLNGEVAAFQARVAATGADPNALYVVFSGSNDVSDILSRGLDPASTIRTAVAGIVNAVDAFKAAGARTALVPNLPDLGVVPSVTRLSSTVPGISALATGLAAQFNAALSAALAQVTGIRIVQFDTFDFLRDVVANPGLYGFTNATQPCYTGFVVPDPTAVTCATPDQYVFWDVEHPTAAFQALLGSELFATVDAVPEPDSWRVMTGAVIAFSAVRLTRRRQRAV